MSVITQFVPGRSLLHRTPAGVKLAGVFLFAVVVALLPAWWQCVPAFGLVLVAYLVTGVPVVGLLRQVRPLAPIVLAVGLFQTFVVGWRTAIDVVLSLVTVVLAAGLVSLTTRTTELTDVLLRLLHPVRRFGVHPERVALLVALSLRSVTVVLGLAVEVRDAQRARGRGASPRAFAVPLLVRSLRHAEQMGEALAARGFDD